MHTELSRISSGLKIISRAGKPGTVVSRCSIGWKVNLGGSLIQMKPKFLRQFFFAAES